MLVRCPYFSTTVYDLDEPIDLDYSDLDSFVILVCVDGNGILTDNEGNVTSLNAGESLLIPATTKWLKVNGSVMFLETYI
jgi:mannose-6-phosphate isomerase